MQEYPAVNKISNAKLKLVDTIQIIFFIFWILTMGIQPQLKTGEIYKKILASINAGDLLIPETELYQLLREARQIPLKAESLSIQGLLYIIWGKIDEGIRLNEEAINEDPYTPAIWLNYALAIGRRCKYKKQREILQRAIKYESPLSIKAALTNALQWPNAELVVLSMTLIEKLKIKITGIDYNDAMRMLIMIEDDNELAIAMSRVVECAMEVAEQNNIKYKSTYIDQFMDEDPCFICRIGEATAEEISDLNESLAISIVRNGLAGSPALAMFERGE